MRGKKILTTASVLVLLTMSQATPVDAQSVALSIQPSVQEIYAKPGTSVQIPIVLRNTGGPTSFQYKAVGLQAKGTYGNLEPISALPAGVTVKITETDAQFFGSGENKNTIVKITVDKTVAEQDYYIGFVAESVGKKHSEGKSSIELVLQQISTILLTVTNGTRLQNQGFINSFTIANNSNVHIFDSHDAIPLDVIAGNSGNNWTFVSGTITSTDSFGSTKQVQIPKQRILAQSSRLLRSLYTNTPTHSMILDGFHIGKYTLKTTLVFEGKPGTQTRMVTFVAFPFKLAGLLFVLIMVAGAVVVRLNRPHPVQIIEPHRM